MYLCIQINTICLELCWLDKIGTRRVKMKLHIKREQKMVKRGILGGEKLEFWLHLKLELSDEERNLAEKYSESLGSIFIIPYSNPEGRPPKRYDSNNPEGPI